MNAKGRPLEKQYDLHSNTYRDVDNIEYNAITHELNNDPKQSSDNLRSKQRRSRSSAWRTNGMHLHLADTKNFSNMERNQNTILPTPKSNEHHQYRNVRLINESAEQAKIISHNYERHTNYRGDTNIAHANKTLSTHSDIPRAWTDTSFNANTGIDVQKMLQELVNISHNLSVYMQTKEKESTRITDDTNNNNNKNSYNNDLMNNGSRITSAKKSLLPLSSMQTTPRQRNAQLNVSEIERIVRRVQAHYTLRIRELELTNEQLKKELLELKTIKNAEPHSLASSKCNSDEDQLNSRSLPSEKKPVAVNQIVRSETSNFDDLGTYGKETNCIALHSLNNRSNNKEEYGVRRGTSMMSVEKLTPFALERNTEVPVVALNNDGAVEKLREELQEERRQRLVVEEQTQKLSEQHVKVVSVLEHRLRKQEEQIRRLINLNRNRWEMENKSAIRVDDNSMEVNDEHNTLHVENNAHDQNEQKCATDVVKKGSSNNIKNLENENVPSIKNKYSVRQNNNVNNNAIDANKFNSFVNQFHNNDDDDDANNHRDNWKEFGTLREMQNKEYFDEVHNVHDDYATNEIENAEENNLLVHANKVSLASKSGNQEKVVTSLNLEQASELNGKLDMEQKTHKEGNEALSRVNRSNTHGEVDEIEELLKNISRELESIHTSL